MKIKKESVLLFFLIFGVYSCKTNKSFLELNSNPILEKHLRVAVLPFKIIFSEDYKRVSSGSRQGNWLEQQRVAGLDLQKEAFTILTKRAIKKQWGFTVQDFLTTNKILKKEDIRFSELGAMEKGKLARLLGVDAVLWGETSIEFEMRSFASRNGMNTQVQLFDAESSIMIWKDEVFQQINNRMESPQDLAIRSVANLINSLPYKKSNNTY